MKKLLKQAKRRIILYRSNILVFVIIAGVLLLGVWHATKPEEVADVPLSIEPTVSRGSQNFSQENYEKALDLCINGDANKGRIAMKNLSPLNQTSRAEYGNAKAHLWMALDILGAENFGFLNVFPMQWRQGVHLKAPMQLTKNPLTVRAKQHLVAAMTLSPELGQAVFVLAEFLIASGDRNEAKILLIREASAHNDELMKLGLSAANVQAYIGDDLDLKEKNWHHFATLGNAIASKDRGNISVRIEYLLHAFSLKEFKLAIAGIDKFERDFSDRELGTRLLLDLKALLAYSQCLDALENNAMELSLAFLIKAFSYQEDRVELVEALKLFSENIPSLKPQIEEGIAGLGGKLGESDPELAANLTLLKSQLSAEKRVDYVREAINYSQTNPDVVLAYVEVEVAEVSSDLETLEKLVQASLKQKNLSKRDQFRLQFCYGKLLMSSERWEPAVVALEKALATRYGESKDKKELHLLLGQTYQALGRNIIADEHFQLAK